jgi:hypothetical protein
MVGHAAPSDAKLGRWPSRPPGHALPDAETLEAAGRVVALPVSGRLVPVKITMPTIIRPQEVVP